MKSAAILLAGLFLLPAGAAGAQPANLEDTLYLQLDCGRVTIVMRPDLAPRHVERIRILTRQGFYDGLQFHRVVPGLLAQTGDPTGTGRGRSQLPDLAPEFSAEPFVRGTVGMERQSNPNTANSQFFITFAPTPWFNGDYTVWGRVVAGMACLESVAPGQGVAYRPPVPDIIISARIAADIAGP
jgi:peptidylprolyl isomerase